MKDSFVFYRSFYESTKGLPIESRLRLFDNICELALNGKDIDGLKGIEENIFTLIRPQIEANNQRYENGKKGGRPNKKTIGYLETKTTGFENEKPNVNVNVNENVNDNENVYIEKTKRFIKPTVEEIEEYCLERNNGIVPNKFYDFYESKNWLVGKNKMKDWKACVRTWENNNKKTQPNSEDLPCWFDKDIEKQKITKQEQEELQRIIEEF